jgi:integrase
MKDLSRRPGKAAGVDTAVLAVADLAPLIGAARFQRGHPPRQGPRRPHRPALRRRHPRQPVPLRRLTLLADAAAPARHRDVVRLRRLPHVGTKRTSAGRAADPGVSRRPRGPARRPASGARRAGRGGGRPAAAVHHRVRAPPRPRRRPTAADLAGKAAKVKVKRLSPHSLRHAIATLSRDAGARLEDIQDALDHADPRTTRRYDRGGQRLDRSPAYTLAAYLTATDGEHRLVDSTNPR